MAAAWSRVRRGSKIVLPYDACCTSGSLWLLFPVYPTAGRRVGEVCPRMALVRFTVYVVKAKLPDMRLQELWIPEHCSKWPIAIRRDE